MPRPKTQVEAFTPGQLAKRWGIGVDRVRALVDAGRLTGAFRIPSAGKYGEAVKIPADTVERAEQDWQVSPASSPKRPPSRRGRNSCPALRNFPELATTPEPGAGCPEGAQG